MSMATSTIKDRNLIDVHKLEADLLVCSDAPTSLLKPNPTQAGGW